MLFFIVTTSLHFHLQSISLLFCSYSCRHFLPLSFLMIVIQTGVRWVISLWFWFAFFCWWVMLNIFSCTCCTLYVSFEKKKKSVPVHCLFWYWVLCGFFSYWIVDMILFRKSWRFPPPHTRTQNQHTKISCISIHE